MTTSEDVKTKHTLDLKTFGFVVRETCEGKTVVYRCGRDFLYYALHYFNPTKYNQSNNSAQQIEQHSVFGTRLPTWFMWTMLQFYKVPRVLRDEHLKLIINGREVNSWWGMVRTLLRPSPPTVKEVEKAIDYAISHGEVVGVDISLSLGGLVDHVMFVYGQDEHNVYFFDTNQVPSLEYEKITDDDRFVMRLAKSDLKKRLKIFSRIWRVVRA